MSNHSEVRDLKSEVIHFKNKYKFMILKITLMPQIYITTSIWILFWCLTYRHNIFKKLAYFICAYFINFRFKVCVLVSLIIGICSTWYFEVRLSYYKWKQLFTQKYATNYQTYLENQLNNFWTWNNSKSTKYHTGDSAEWIRIIWAQFGGEVLGTLSGESVFIRP